MLAGRHSNCSVTRKMEAVADDELASQGIFVDDVHQLRILDPSSAEDSVRFKDECNTFVQCKFIGSISVLCADKTLFRKASSRFQETVQQFCKQAEKMAQLVDAEKQKALGFRLLVDAETRKRNDERLQLKVTKRLHQNNSYSNESYHRWRLKQRRQSCRRFTTRWTCCRKQITFTRKSSTTTNPSTERTCCVFFLTSRKPSHKFISSEQKKAFNQ